MFPYENADLPYFQVSRIFCLIVVFLRFILCISFYKAMTRYYYVLSNRILYKSKMDQDTVEKRRNERMNQNFTEKRQEKNLNTVIESMNEVNDTEHQKTSVGDQTSMKNRNTKTRIYEGMISEEDNEDTEESKGFKKSLKSSFSQYPSR